MARPWHGILDDISLERTRQDWLFPDQHLPNGTAEGERPESVHRRDLESYETRSKANVRYHVSQGSLEWMHVLTEEVAEAYAAETPAALRRELVQVAAVAVRWIEDLDRKRG